MLCVVCVYFPCQVFILWIYSFDTRSKLGSLNFASFVADGIKDISITVTPNKTFYDQSTTYIDIKCFSDGNPTTNYSWFRKSDTNVTIGTDNVYRIEPVTEDKNGTYICVATNTVNDVEYRLLADILVNIGWYLNIIHTVMTNFI